MIAWEPKVVRIRYPSPRGSQNQASSHIRRATTSPPVQRVRVWLVLRTGDIMKKWNGTWGDLKRLMVELGAQDDLPVLVPGLDHSFYAPGSATVTIALYDDGGDWTEDDGDDDSTFGVPKQIICIG